MAMVRERGHVGISGEINEKQHNGNGMLGAAADTMAMSKLTCIAAALGIAWRKRNKIAYMANNGMAASRRATIA